MDDPPQSRCPRPLQPLSSAALTAPPATATAPAAAPTVAAAATQAAKARPVDRVNLAGGGASLSRP